MAERIALRVAAGGDRVDRFLAAHSLLSRSAIQRLARDGHVRVDGEVVEPAYKVRAGQELIVDVPDAGRYELRLGGRLVGLAAYRRREGRIAFTHTEVDESCEGRGFGSRLAEAALDDARRQGLDVVPLCPFISRFIERHPEYGPLVASGQRLG